ncbi:MAG: winged helix-turn-helix transcriptional regulator [Fimbriimonadaceae bacterium]|nr:winged helix-turn-helix transcriptional regulator [Fimbriimonadaceae bacterium]QYK55689.1 MAG: winged helix-turn-helix transcriptional regulator [Fimbriimonadaceae bacterium]
MEPVEREGDADLRCSLRRFKADVFQVLANPTRIHIIECLRDGELSVKAIQEQLGVEASNTSQHLAVLRGKGLVVTRKERNQVFYSLRDPLLTEVLDAMKKYFKSHLKESLAMLQGLDR